MNKKAFLFDMDGTMIDNMQFHFLAWEKMLAELGGGPSGEELFRNLYGKAPELLSRIYGNERFTQDEMQQIGDVKEGYYREIYAPHIKLMPGLAEFLAEADSRGIPMAIGTASNMANIELMLKATGIEKYFSGLVSADHVSKSKPDPETWLKAAELLKTAVGDCIVFEDVPKGVEAAANAGMKTVVLTTTHKKEEFSGFENIIATAKDFTALSIDSLLRIQ